MHMMRTKPLEVGDLVFGRVTGLLPWPAIVLHVRNKNECTLAFYENDRVQIMNKEDVVHYEDYKMLYVNNFTLRNDQFRRAACEIQVVASRFEVAARKNRKAAVVSAAVEFAADKAAAAKAIAASVAAAKAAAAEAAAAKAAAAKAAAAKAAAAEAAAREAAAAEAAAREAAAAEAAAREAAAAEAAAREAAAAEAAAREAAAAEAAAREAAAAEAAAREAAAAEAAAREAAAAEAAARQAAAAKAAADAAAAAAAAAAAGPSGSKGCIKKESKPIVEEEEVVASTSKNAGPPRRLSNELAMALAKALANKPSDSESDAKNDLLLAYSNSKLCIGIKLDYGKPKSFANPEEQKLWEDNMYQECCILRDKLELGLIKADHIRKRLVFKPSHTRVHPDEVKKFTDRMIVQEETLVTERDMMRHILRVRDSLGYKRADLKRCLHHLKIVEKFDVGPMSLTRHPIYVDTVRRLRNYVGNLKNWKLSPADAAEFEKDTATIRETADKMYNNFKVAFKPFNFDENDFFWGQYCDMSDEYKKIAKQVIASNRILITESAYKNILAGKVTRKNRN